MWTYTLSERLNIGFSEYSWLAEDTRSLLPEIISTLEASLFLSHLEKSEALVNVSHQGSGEDKF